MIGPTDGYSPDELELLARIGRPAGGIASYCPEAARLRAYTAEALPGEQRREMESHIAVCPPCRAMEADLAQWPDPVPEAEAVAGLWRRIEARLPDAHPETPRRGWKNWLWLVAPATAAAMLCAAAFAEILARPVAPPPQLAASIAAPAYFPLTAVRIEPAPLRLPAGALLLWRGGAESAPPGGLADALVDGLVHYRQGDFSEAARRLAGLAANTALGGPESFEANFYAGVSLLLIERPAEAIPLLEQARRLAAPAQAGDASWYFALACLRSGAVHPARAPLEDLCFRASEHKESACLLLRQLAAPAPAFPR